MTRLAPQTDDTAVDDTFVAALVGLKSRLGEVERLIQLGSSQVLFDAPGPDERNLAFAWLGALGLARRLRQTLEHLAPPLPHSAAASATEARVVLAPTPRELLR